LRFASGGAPLDVVDGIAGGACAASTVAVITSFSVGIKTFDGKQIQVFDLAASFA
jgi:hypothetical protein